MALPACSAEESAPATDLCTPYTALCIAGAVHICQPDGNVDFSFACAAGQSCADGECIGTPVATTDAGGGVTGGTSDGGTASTGATTGEGTAGGGTGAEDGCLAQKDLEAYAAGKTIEKGTVCIEACAGETETVKCLESCLMEDLSAACSGCTAAWIGCTLHTCGAECALALDEACFECAAANCTGDMLTCSGLTMEQLLGENGASVDGGGANGGTGDGSNGGGTDDAGTSDGPPGWEDGKACSLDDYAAFVDGSYQPIKEQCAAACESLFDSSEADFTNCATGCLTGIFSAGCAACGAAYQWCEQEECFLECGDDHELPACAGCLDAECLPAQVACAGVKLKLF